MPEMKKHTNEGSFVVDIKDSAVYIGPMSCPQSGCRGGNVHLLIYGGDSGDYMTEVPCKCCDSKGQLYEGEPAYRSYCFANGVRHLRTGYPYPVPMSSSLYNSKELSERVKERELNQKKDDYESKPHKASSGCFLTTACVEYAKLSDNCETLTTMRQFRDEHVVKSEIGQILIDEYYRTAPMMVSAINRLSPEHQNNIYGEILQLLNDVVILVKQGNYNLAEVEYMKMYFRVKEITRGFVAD